MATITLSIPDELKNRLAKHPEVNWAEVLRSSLIRKVKLLKEFRQFADSKGERF